MTISGIVIDAVGLSEKTAPEDVATSTVNALGLAQGGVMFVFFVLVDGWALVTGSLVKSFGGG